MKKLALAAAFVLIAMSAALAQAAGFNPGTVIGNTYDDLARRGYGPGFGFGNPLPAYAPSHGPYRHAPGSSRR